MMYSVIKRDGQKERFNPEKVQTAMELSGVSSERSSMLTKFVQDTMYQNTDVETIHSMVLEVLRANNELEAAERYASYKEGRDQERSKPNDLLKLYTGIVGQTDKEVLTENANKPGEQLPVMRDLIAGEVSKHFFVKHGLPKRVASAHNDGTIYIHDLQYIGLPMTNCCLVDLKGMLENGFRMGNAHIETPKSIITAASVTAQAIAQVSCNQYGGTTIPNIDVTLAPYVEKTYQKHLNQIGKYIFKDLGPFTADDQCKEYANEMTLKDITAAAQNLEYEINTLFTSNGQSPFVTFTFGLGECKWSRELQKAILNQRIKGLGKEGVTPVFPKLVFWHKEGLNVEKDSPNYEIKQLAVQCTSKRMYPDHLSYDRLTEFTGGAPSPMGR